MKRLALILCLSVPASLLAGETGPASRQSPGILDAEDSRLSLLRDNEPGGSIASHGESGQSGTVYGKLGSRSNAMPLGLDEMEAASAMAVTCQGSLPLGVGNIIRSSGSGNCDVPYPLCTGPGPYPGRTCCVILPHIPNVGRVWFCLRQVNPPFEFETVASGICN